MKTFFPAVLKNMKSTCTIQAAKCAMAALSRAVTPLLLGLALVSPLVTQAAVTAGPTAVAYLGWLMGLEVVPSKTVNAAGKSIVFAVSGAGTGEGAGDHVKEALLGYGMMNQVRDFASRVKSGEISFDPQTTLFLLAGGLNDGRRETAIMLPTKIPPFAAVGLRLNPAYEQFVRQEAAAGFDLWPNHWSAAFDEVMEHPASHGIVNTTSACAGRAIFDQDPTPVGDPATYFFNHDGHPSTAVHRIVGQKLFEEIAARPPAAQ